MFPEEYDEVTSICEEDKVTESQANYTGDQITIVLLKYTLYLQIYIVVIDKLTYYKLLLTQILCSNTQSLILMIMCNHKVLYTTPIDDKIHQ